MTFEPSNTIFFSYYTYMYNFIPMAYMYYKYTLTNIKTCCIEVCCIKVCSSETFQTSYESKIKHSPCILLPCGPCTMPLNTLGIESSLFSVCSSSLCNQGPVISNRQVAHRRGVCCSRGTRFLATGTIGCTGAPKSDIFNRVVDFRPTLDRR